MDELKLNVESVIEKWSSHHSHSVAQNGDEKTWYKNYDKSNAAEDFSAIYRRRSKKLMKSKQRDERTLDIEKVLQSQRRFKLTPLLLKNTFQDYQTHQCKKCQNVLEFVKINTDSQITSQPLHLMDYITCTVRKNLFSFLGPSLSFAGSEKGNETSKSKNQTNQASRSRNSVLFTRLIACKILGYLQASFTSLCFQTKDEMTLINNLRQMDYPTIFVHDCKDILTTLILHLYLVFLDSKTPLTVVDDSKIASSLLRYVLSKIGFVFVDKNDTENRQETLQTLLNFLETNHSILIPSRDYPAPGIPPSSTSSTSYNVIDEILQAQRDKDPRLQRAILVPTMLSIEAETNESRTLSFIDLLGFSFFPRKYGISYFNLALPIKLKSIVKVAAELNTQETSEEENSIISRHMNFDFQETGVLLPINILSFVLYSKHRHSVNVSISDLMLQVEDLISELKELNKYVGFTGATDSITHHGLDVMQAQDILVIDSSTGTIRTSFDQPKKVQKLYKHSVKVLHCFLPRAILASSIIACCSGELAMHQGNGFDLTLTGSKVLEKAEFMSELIAFNIDFYCSFTMMTETLAATLERFVEMEVLKLNENVFEDHSHQRLARNIDLDLEFEDDDNDRHSVSIDSTYQLVQNNKGIEMLQYYARCASPFVELCYTLLAIIREQLQDQKFSVEDLLKLLSKRYKKGFFKYGEMLTIEAVSRFCDYLFESGVIDDDKDMYTLSQHYQDDTNLSWVVYRLSELRCDATC